MRFRSNLNVMIRSLFFRNALSLTLFVVAVLGIVQQLHEIHEGLVFPQTRLVLIAYFLIAIYALASVVVRIRAMRGKN